MEVTFTKKYPYAAFCNLDLGGKTTIPVSAESTCDDNKESFFNELDKLNDWCNEWFKSRYGEYEEQVGTIEKVIYSEPQNIEKPLPQTTEEKIMALIESATTIKGLEFFKKSVANNSKQIPSLQIAYDNKLKSLK